MSQTTQIDPGAGAEGEVLDVVVVGGGPGGTAAAFRARELGLAALVLDYDDLMKRIRDYSKDKLILPSFGGGDKMSFPKAGPLVDALRFAPIDKDEMCQRWKALYREHGVTARVGCELTELERRGDGLYEVRAWDHGARSAASFLARHVVLAIGRGVPRRFDIPGDCDGIAFRLADAESYVGRPACVVGGGTSAAEAVIAISNAKAAAGDETEVYWSYRGDRMPRVSKALAEVFFEAYVGNGNVRYCPRSEPAAIVTGDDHEEYLAVRVDRRRMAGRPSETTHLEFPKGCCVACIGEDIPEELLASFGIHMATGGPHGRKRMVVNRYLETRQKNVYLIGDILSQAYFETDDFDADPAGFREVKHRGNIKSALRDGVLVAQVIHQRLAGREEIDLELEDDEELVSERSQAIALLGGEEAGDAGPPPESLEAGRRVVEGAAFLVRVLPGGIEEDEHPIPEHGVVTLGREGCDLSFPEDTQLAPRHASISHTDEGVFLRDDGSTTGVFLRLPFDRKVAVGVGDLVRAGRQFLLVSRNDGAFFLHHFDHTGRERGRHPLRAGTIVLGRQAPDVTLDADDRTLSRRQLAVTLEAGGVSVKDLKSANGSYLRVRESRRLEHGDHFRVGQQLLALSLRADAVLDTGHVATQRPSPPPVAAAAPSSVPASAAAGAATGGVTVTFGRGGQVCPVAPGQTLCEAAEACGVPITAECHSGICGSDPIRILSGRENLADEAGPGESETLLDLCDLEPGEHRLACMVRLKGPVEVELVES